MFETMINMIEHSYYSYCMPKGIVKRLQYAIGLRFSIQYTLPMDQLFNLEFQFESVFNLEFQFQWGQIWESVVGESGNQNEAFGRKGGSTKMTKGG